MKIFDAIIIGSGQGGTPLSKKLAKAGLQTALIEKQHYGGTCVNVGCTPTKTMIASAKAIYQVKQAHKLGVDVKDFEINMTAIVNRKNEVVKKFNEGSVKGLEATDNLHLFMGEASFTGNKTIEVKMNDGSSEMMTAEKIFIDAGAHPAIPGIKGLKEAGYHTSTSIMEMKKVPAHLLIIGGAYIGLEFGQMFRRFGSQVTILEYGERFLPKEDEDVADAIKSILEKEGIHIITGAQTQRIQKTQDNIIASVKINGSEQEIECTDILVAAGREPNSKPLNLQLAGVDTDERGYITVNDRLETSAPGIYALGDIKGGPEFTHIAYNDHLVILDHLLHNGQSSVKGRMVPYTMFTDPQLGRIGITEQEALEKKLPIRVAVLPMTKVARAIETGDTRGMMKAVVNKDDGKILGAAILGQEGGEIMSVVQMAMVGNISWQQVRHMIFAHPLYSESLNNLFMQLEDEA